MAAAADRTQNSKYYHHFAHQRDRRQDLKNMINSHPLKIAAIFLAVTVASSAFALTAPTAQNQNHAFSNGLITTTTTRSSSSSSLSMAPRFDKNSGKWFTDKSDEMDGSSYGPFGSLFRAGPKPFLQRIFNAETYDQAVLKYMAQDGCDRKEAQGNMDAFLENPQVSYCFIFISGSIAATLT